MQRLSRCFPSRSARFLLAGVLSLIATAAMAQEQLIMPYACTVQGGRVTLTPSREEAYYRIYGQREQRPYTVCSPINPSICRTWLLHRFDLDCGGARVDWLSVAEAGADMTPGRAWVEDGRLRLRMNQYWGRDESFDDPCPRWRRRGPYGDDCIGRRNFERPRGVIDMPPGFAPSLGLPIRFAQSDVPTSRPDSFSNSGAPYAGSGVPFASKEPPAKTARIEAPRDLPAKEPLAKEPVAKDLPTKEPTAKLPQATTSTTGTAAKAPSHPGAATPDAQSDAVAAAQAKPKRTEPVREAAAEPISPNTGVSVIPKIINRPGSSKSEQAAADPVIAAKPTTPATVKPSEPVQIKDRALDAPKRSESTDAAPGHSALSFLTPSATTQALVGFLGLVVVALGFFAYTRRREQLSLASAGPREFANVSFEPRPRPQSRARPGTALAGPRPGAVVPGRPPRLPPVAAPAAVPLAEGQMPRTRDEACQVLGTSPDAGEAVIKKVVEGLRQSWHPDLATSEADRVLREQRTTQINVAWDILSGKRPNA